MNDQYVQELRLLARKLQGLSGTYTRLYGSGGNGDRVADLLTQDAFEIGQRIEEILESDDLL